MINEYIDYLIKLNLYRIFFHLNWKFYGINFVMYIMLLEINHFNHLNEENLSITYVQ